MNTVKSISTKLFQNGGNTKFSDHVSGYGLLKKQERKFYDNNRNKICSYVKKLEDLKNKQILKKHQFDQAQKFKMSLVQYQQLQKKAIDILAELHTGHSMGCYRRLFINNVLFAKNDVLYQYSNSCKYKPTYGDIKINISKSDLIKIEKIEGVWTIPGKNHKAKWIEANGEKQFFNIEVKNGFLFGDTHGETLEQAKNDFRKKLIAKKRKQLGDKKFVGYQHIREAGACHAGIMAFVQKHNLNKDLGYNLGYLKSLDNNSFLQNI